MYIYFFFLIIFYSIVIVHEEKPNNVIIPPVINYNFSTWLTYLYQNINRAVRQTKPNRTQCVYVAVTDTDDVTRSNWMVTLILELWKVHTDEFPYSFTYVTVERCISTTRRILKSTTTTTDRPWPENACRHIKCCSLPYQLNEKIGERINKKYRICAWQVENITFFNVYLNINNYRKIILYKLILILLRYRLFFGFKSINFLEKTKIYPWNRSCAGYGNNNTGLQE